MNKLMRNPAGLVATLILVIALLPVSVSGQTPRGMGVAPDALPEALRGLAPKDYFVPSSQKKVGVIHALEGKVVVVHRTTKEAYFGKEGDAIYEKDALSTLADSRCRIRMVDEDVITMAPETDFSVDEFQDQRAEGKKSSFFSMLKGKAMFYAMRLFRYRDTRFTLKTPTVTVGVRGTKFGAHVYYEGEKKAEERSVRVADAGSEVAPYLAAAGPGGGRSYTDVISWDGVLDVDGKIVTPGQMFNGRKDEVFRASAELMEGFIKATEMARAPTLETLKVTSIEVFTATIENQQRELDPEQRASSTPGPAPTTDTGSVADVTQGDVAQKVTEETLVKKEIVPFPGQLGGYFALLLKRNPSGTVLLQDSFLSSPPHHTGDNIDAYLVSTATFGSGEPDYLFYHSSKIEDSDYLNAYISPNSGESVLTNLEGTYHYLGQNQYNQWGYWKSNSPTTFTLGMGAGANTYQFVQDKVWFVEHMEESGTKMEQIDNIALTKPGEYNYGGVALGTYFDPTSTADLSGTFNSKVVFGSATITQFNMNLTGGGHRVDYAFTGSVPVSSLYGGWTNMFTLNNLGTATIDGVSATQSVVNGSLYGPNAEEMAGVWGVHYRPEGSPSSADKGAAGIFAGKQQSTP